MRAHRFMIPGGDFRRFRRSYDPPHATERFLFFVKTDRAPLITLCDDPCEALTLGIDLTISYFV